MRKFPRPAGPAGAQAAPGQSPWPVEAPPEFSADGAPELTAESVSRQVQAVQDEVDALKAELNLLRRRDETLNFYMHRIDEELRLAARLQQDFLPRALPQLGRVRFHTLFRPAGYVSGDLYDVMRLDETRMGFYIADAVGHGIPAALLTMFIKNALVTREIAGNEYRLLPPGEALARLNQALIDQNLSQAAFATALYGIIDVETLEVTIARAGHPSPLLLRCAGDAEEINADGPLLGIFPDEAFADVHLKLAPGDRLLLYTDGIEVAFNNDGALDTGRWRDEIISRAALPSGQLLLEFSECIDQQTGSLEPKDDLTMVLIEVEPQAA